tara:strand:- start:45359 stop:46801 length:1443 start_codon:yes stop_codon:yes gene_type:complete
MYKLLIMLYLFLACFSTVEAIIITEIMYDPEGKDNNKEYVEILTEGKKLENYTIEDYGATDQLILKKESNSSYSLIVEEEFNYSKINATIYTVGATIGNNLNNDKDLVLLRNQENKILDAIIYSSKKGGSNNNKALCKTKNELYECLPSPGKADKGQKQRNESYQLTITEFLPNPKGQDTAPAPKGEWIELYNEGEEIDLQGFQLQDKNNHKITLSDVHFLEDSMIQSKEYKIVYLNGKTLLNNEGPEKIQLQLATQTLDTVSYDGAREDVSWSKHPKGHFVLSKPTPGKENEIEEENLKTNISIKNIYLGKDKKVKFGEQLRIRLEVYKGDTTKNNIKIYVKGISKQTSFNVYKKFQKYIFTLPIQLDPNCKGKQEDGSYELVVDGLDKSVIQLINVTGITKRLCETVKVNVTKKEKKKTIPLKTTKKGENEVVSNTLLSKEGIVVYESNDAKAKRYALYFFCLVMICIVGAYVFGIQI